MPEEEIPTKMVTVTITAEVSADAVLDPSLYRVVIQSTEDPWFDMYAKSITITENL